MFLKHICFDLDKVVCHNFLGILDLIFTISPLYHRHQTRLYNLYKIYLLFYISKYFIYSMFTLTEHFIVFLSIICCTANLPSRSLRYIQCSGKHLTVVRQSPLRSKPAKRRLKASLCSGKARCMGVKGPHLPSWSGDSKAKNVECKDRCGSCAPAMGVAGIRRIEVVSSICSEAMGGRWDV